MTSFQLFCQLLEAEYSYATTDITPPAEVADLVLEWNRLNIPEDALFVDEDGGKGREKEVHVTCLYGLQGKAVPEALRALAKDTAPFPVVIGKVSLFTNNPHYDVVKLDVESPWLRQLHARIKADVPNEEKYDEYHPHLTLAYVVKGTCDHMTGEDPFKGDPARREFTAAGLHFRGSGSEDDPDRTVELLLFSKVPEPKSMAEAVLQPSPEDVQAVIRVIADRAREAKGDVKLFLQLVAEPLADLNVSFVPRSELHGSHGGASETGCTLPVPSRFDLNDPGWPASLYPILHHEGVHLMQLDRAADPKKVSDAANREMLVNGQIDLDKYLVNKQEVMAWAASLVDSWRRQELTSEEMLARLRSGNWDFAMKYWQNRKKYPVTFNRFVTQATAYINQLREAALTVPDPFGRCAFPTDAGNVRQFLRAKAQTVVNL